MMAMSLNRALLAVSAILLATGATAETLTIGTTPAGTLNNRMGVAIGTLIHRETDVQTRVTPYSGTEQFVPLVNSGEVDFAIPSATDALFALKGVEVYQGHPNPELRAVGSLIPLFLSVLVRESSGIRSFGDLRGKPVAVGYTNHAQARRYFRGVMASYGMSAKDVQGVAVPHVIAGVNDLMQGKVEGAMFAIGVPKLAEIEAKVGKIRFLSVNASPEGVKALRRFVPTADVVKIKPKAKRLGIVAPTNMLAERYLLVTGSKLSDERAYQAAKLLYAKQGELVKILGAFRLYKPNQLARNDGIPYHPGAEKFYRKAGIWQGK